MLNKRYEFDGKPTLKLNKLQLKNKKLVEDKINSKEYTFEKVNCVICNGSDFELLAEKDRYGLYVPTVICKKCGLLQTNPRMNQESYNKFYDSNYRRLYEGGENEENIASFFNKQVSHGESILMLIEREREQIIDLRISLLLKLEQVQEAYCRLLRTETTKSLAWI